MQISVAIPNILEQQAANLSLLARVKFAVCTASLKTCVVATTVFVAIIVVAFVCRTYLALILIWAERQDTIILYLVLLLLFVVVSLPICVGYVAIVIATGYLFNFKIGLLTCVICANTGVFVAHNLIRTIGRHSLLRMSNKTTLTLAKLVSGTHTFKIVVCARLTPIPFGLQNAIFALGNVPGKIYYAASLLGLIPGQVVGVYIGSSVRSMQDILDNTRVEGVTYLIASVQLILGAALLIWLGSKARNELSRAITEADSSLSKSDTKAGFTIV